MKKNSRSQEMKARLQKAHRDRQIILQAALECELSVPEEERRASRNQVEDENEYCQVTGDVDDLVKFIEGDNFNDNSKKKKKKKKKAKKSSPQNESNQEAKAGQKTDLLDEDELAQSSEEVSPSKLEYDPEIYNLNQDLMIDVAEIVVAILSEPTREPQVISIKRFFLPDKSRPQVTVTLLGCTAAEDQLKFSNVDEQDMDCEDGSKGGTKKKKNKKSNASQNEKGNNLSRNLETTSRPIVDRKIEGNKKTSILTENHNLNQQNKQHIQSKEKIQTQSTKNGKTSKTNPSFSNKEANKSQNPSEQNNPPTLKQAQNSSILKTSQLKQNSTANKDNTPMSKNVNFETEDESNSKSKKASKKERQRLKKEQEKNQQNNKDKDSGMDDIVKRTSEITIRAIPQDTEAEDRKWVSIQRNFPIPPVRQPYQIPLRQIQSLQSLNRPEGIEGGQPGRITLRRHTEGTNTIVSIFRVGSTPEEEVLFTSVGGEGLRTAPEIITEKLLEIEKKESSNDSKTTKKKLKKKNKKNQASGDGATSSIIVGQSKKNPIQTKPLTKTNVNSVNSSQENLESIGDWKPPPGITLTRLKRNDKKERNL